MNILQLIGRDSELFEDDIKKFGKELDEIIAGSRFWVVGVQGVSEVQSSKRFSKEIQKNCTS